MDKGRPCNNSDTIQVVDEYTYLNKKLIFTGNYQTAEIEEGESTWVGQAPARFSVLDTPTPKNKNIEAMCSPSTNLWICDLYPLRK